MFSTGNKICIHEKNYSIILLLEVKENQEVEKHLVDAFDAAREVSENILFEHQQ